MELKEQLEVEEEDKGQTGGKGRSRKGEASQGECAMDGMEMTVNALRS